jgi:RNase adapter protein RapZ
MTPGRAGAALSRIVVVSGLSGAGRSVAGGALEDLGWFVIDNLPPSLVTKVAELANGRGEAGYERVVLVLSGSSTDPTELVDQLRSRVDDVRMLFLEASSDVLVRRYESTKRRHPLAQPDRSVPEAIEVERRQLSATRAAADIVVDTTDLNPHQLRERLVSLFGDDSTGSGMQLSIRSFGYKNGLPLDADVVFDCRFLPNPHWVDELRPQTGRDADVAGYIFAHDIARDFVDKVLDLLDLLLPAYAAEGRSYLSIAFGCTGGRHRSVAIAELLGTDLAERGWAPQVAHRDLER